MTYRDIPIRFSSELLSSAVAVALEQDVTLGHYVRELIRRDLSRRAKARPSVYADETLVAPLRARLAGDLAFSNSWEELQARLNAQGFALREAGGGLALHAWPGGARICKASELGFSYGKLMCRFDAPLPGHAHHWLIPEFSTQQPKSAGPHASRRHDTESLVADRADYGSGDDDDFEVIEIERHDRRPSLDRHVP